MKTQLRVLHLEDSPYDAELVRTKLEEEGFSCDMIVACNKAAFESAIAEGLYDLILSDFQLPDFDGLAALSLARERHPHVPFILLSGTLGEEQAVESLKGGATDYILKQRLTRLVPAVRRALNEAEALAQRKQAEERLRQSQELFRQITENVEDLIVVLDLQGRRVFSSPSYRRLLGDPELLVGTDSFAEIHAEDRERIQRIFNETVTTGVGQRAEYRFVLKDGTVRFIESQGSVIRDRDGRVSNVLVVSRDITERKQAEEALRASEERFQVALKNSSIVVFNQDRELRYTWSHNMQLGRTHEELIGKTDAELLSQGDASRLTEIKRQVMERGVGAREEVQIISGGKTFYYDLTVEPLRDAAGAIVGITGAAMDITERKQVEAQFLRAQRLESIGALASGVAHDLNNILAPILMSAPMLRWGLKPEEMEKTLASIESSAQRGAALVKQLLTFGRGVEGKRTLVEPKPLIKEIVRMARETFPKGIAIKSRMPDEVWSIEADATQVHQVLLNLCVNARDAMPEGGTLTISAENVPLDEPQASMIPDAEAGSYVLLQVTDTGTGIPTEIMDKIFDPFFTTKELGKGTGLGLSTALGIVKSHGGFLDVRSEVGKGTMFSVYLPATPTRQAAAQAASVEVVGGQGEVILVVDDEPQILAITQKTLEKNGYKVLVAEDGVAAMASFTKHEDAIEAVVTDLDMPFMDGVALVRGLKRLDSNLPVIACTGIGSEQSLHEKTAALRELGVQVFLSKPYAAPTLLNALHEVLHNSHHQSGGPEGSNQKLS